MPRFALSALPALALLALTGCSNYGAFDVGVTQGGAQDLSLARGQIEAGGIPDQSAITAEGLFSEHDLPLEGDACAQLLCPVTAAASVDPLDGSGPQLLAQLGFHTNVGADFERRPLNAVAVVDVSGSMSGEKLALAQQAMLRMVDQLGEDDRMGLVTFGNLARSVQRPVRMNDRGKERMRAEIEDLSTRGSTSVEAGLREGFDQVHRNSGEAGVEDRVFVFTDARPNVDATDPDSFVELAREQAEQGVGVSLIGVGQDLGADLAVKMSEVRGGIFHFLADEEDAERVFVDEFDFNVTPVAYDLEVRMSAGPGVAFGEGFAAPLDQAAEDVDFGASTLFLSARSGGMGVSLTLEEGADLDQLGTLALSYETIDGALEADEVTLSFAGGEAWGTEVVAADDVGVFKMAALVDELHALRGAADFCDGLLDAAEAERRASEAAARLAATAEALGEDPALSAEVQLMELLLENLQVSGQDACISSYF